MFLALIAAVALLTRGSNSFLVVQSPKNHPNCGPRQSTFNKPLTSELKANPRCHTPDHDDHDDAEPITIVLIDWECVTDTVSHRISVGIQAALHVWPHLQNNLIDQADDLTWLHNKLHALSHVLAMGSSCSENKSSVSSTVEFALATRLLLEEQELDQGESNGKRGKYASKFHPRINNSDETSNTSTYNNSTFKPKPISNRDTNRIQDGGRSTRPLTVGEISVNWKNNIRDTLQVRYHVNYQNPIPILQQAVEELQETIVLHPPPSLHTRALSILSNPSQRTIVLTVPCPSDMQLAQSMFADVKVDFEVIHSADQLRSVASNDDTSFYLCSSSVQLLDLIKSAPNNSQTLVVDSSWSRLQDQVAIFGDYIPRPNNVQNTKCVVPNRFLSLYLADWTAHPTQQSSATMNPWTNVLTWDVLESIVAPMAFQ